MIQMLRRLSNRIRYRRFDDDIVEELALHRELKAKELDRERARVTPGRLTIERAMGNELRMRELARDVWMPSSVVSVQQDLRDVRRMLVRRPFFTAMAVAVLVAGVGAATIYLDQPSFLFPILREVRARSSFFTNAFVWNPEQYGRHVGDRI